MADQVKSRERVQQHGEVFTAEREVNAMLDLVKAEAENVSSTFLEPACGDGNFLDAILQRKLAIPSEHAKKKRMSQLDYELEAMKAIASLYGIDILADNVARCQERLLATFTKNYAFAVGKKKMNPDVIASASYLLSKNIIHGNALDYHRVDRPEELIVISEWGFFNRNKVTRRDFVFVEMVEGDAFGGYQDRPLDIKFPSATIYTLNKSTYGE